MRQVWDFVKTTVLGGAIFLLPIAAILVIVAKAGKMAVDTAMPLAEKLPFPKGEAVLAVYVAGAIALLLVAFAAGVFARSVSIKGNTVSFVEDRILNRFPPYVAIRKQTDRLAGIETDENLKPALVRVHNGWQIGFLVDTFSDGHVAVFIPGAPDPSSGVVQIISSDNVTPIDISHRDVLACLEQSGRGLPNLLGRSFSNQLSDGAGRGMAAHEGDGSL
jgi:uncharacterized membrane protein